jgi:hypothetical protein
MQRLSSNTTLLLKFFIPVFWIVLFGASTLAALLYQYDYVGNTPAIYFKLGMLFFYITGLLLFAFTLLRLKRVEADSHFFYVTNYFKAARYPFHNIERITVSRFLLVSVATIYFAEPGIFGKQCFFVPSHRLLQAYWLENPKLRERLVEE